MFCLFFFFNDTATTEIYPLSLHDALPIFHHADVAGRGPALRLRGIRRATARATRALHAKERRRDRRPALRSEEHTPEPQPRQYLVCRPLLAKKKNRRPAPGLRARRDDRVV